MAWFITLTWVSHRIRAPDHHAVGLRHLARIGPGEPARPGDEAGPGHRGADRRILPGISLGMAQPVDAVAHHQPHRAGIIIRPDRLGADSASMARKRLGNVVQRLVPADALERAGALRPGAAHRMESAGRDGGCARNSARLSRRSPRPCSCWRFAPRTRPMLRPSMTSTSSDRRRGSHAGRPNGRFLRGMCVRSCPGN